MLENGLKVPGTGMYLINPKCSCHGKRKKYRHDGNYFVCIKNFAGGTA